jgi:uncharacterized protein with PIN domain
VPVVLAVEEVVAELLHPLILVVLLQELQEQQEMEVHLEGLEEWVFSQVPTLDNQEAMVVMERMELQDQQHQDLQELLDQRQQELQEQQEVLDHLLLLWV